MAIKRQQAFKNAFTQALIVSLTPVLPLRSETFKAHIRFNQGGSVNYQLRPHPVTLFYSSCCWGYTVKHCM